MYLLLQYGGREGASLLRDHAIEEREILESSISNQNLNMATSAQFPLKGNRNAPAHTSTSESSIMDNSDTMAQLNLMISKFESLSQPQNLGSHSKGSKNDNSRNRLV